MLVHDRGYLITARPGGTFAFARPDGTTIPSSPALPSPERAIGDCHDADITPDTIIPPWYGERLDLDHAIYVCLANEQNTARRRDGKPQPSPDEPEPFRPKGWVSEPSDWIGWIERWYQDHAAA
jgi:hypothetical protein